jgi:conjugative relaxase-like TrwC/TraI family protein
MLRFKPIRNDKRAEDYYSATDGGYYLDGTGLKSKFGGLGADRLGLSALTPAYDHVKNLGRGLDPFTGEQLTARQRGNRIWGWDATGCVPKGVTEALEGGDERIQPSFWRALERAMNRVEQYSATRVRIDGRYEDRVTGNLVWYAIEHAETRPVEDESLPDGHKWKLMPDPDRHIHVVIFNVTWDEEEQRWKAVKFRPIMDLRKYFSHCFDAELAAEMAGLGYEIDVRFKPDRKGNLKYYSWDIKGIPDSVKATDSRRSREVEKIEAAIVAERKKQDKYAPDELSPVEKDKLGGTSRLTKRDDLTLAECREFWEWRRTDDERHEIAETIRRARQGLNPPPENRLAAAVSFSMRHHFEKESALPVEELIATALEHAMGTARPDDVEQELKRQGVIIVEKNGRRLATTEALQDEELSLAAFAMDGRGTVAPVGVADGLDRLLPTGERLSDGQWEAALGLLRSANRVEVITGPAGAGKSKLLKKFDEGVRLAGQSVTYLGTTSASVKVLTQDGFEANTLARFLLDKKMQAAAHGGRVVIDETSILSHKDAVELFRVARENDLKLIFVGDPMQHGSIGRGAFMRLMIEHGRVVPFKLMQILRQKDPAYRAAAQLLSEGKAAEGFESLDQLGWVAEMPNSQERYARMAADYVEALGGGTKWNGVLVIAPTHHEAGCVTQEIRARLRDRGRLSGEEREFIRLVPVEASEAERGLASAYHAGDIIQF